MSFSEFDLYRVVIITLLISMYKQSFDNSKLRIEAGLYLLGL